jgi:hypothetical protein
MSLGMAVAMGAVAWRLLREERRRSAARVAALADMAQSRKAHGRPTEGARKARGRPTDIATEIATESNPAAWDSLPLRPLEPGVAAPVATPALFAPPSSSSRLGPRLLALSAAAVVMAAGVWGVWRLSERGAAGAPAAAAGAAPIELVSLASDRQGDALRITGMVQNPADGVERRDIVAVAFLFDRSGHLVGSGTAPVDDTWLVPGDASPFVIVVDHAGTVARYRLGFRARDGQVLAHVDRRGDTAAAGGVASAGASHPQSD